MFGRPQAIVPLLALLAGAAWAAACGDGGTEPPPPDPPRATTLTITPATVELTALGETVRLAAEVRDQYGQAMAGATVTWTSGNASVATVDTSGAGGCDRQRDGDRLGERRCGFGERDGHREQQSVSHGVGDDPRPDAR